MTSDPTDDDAWSENIVPYPGRGDPERDARHQQLLEEARMTYGTRQRVNPYTALLNEVQHRAGHVAWLREQVQTTLQTNTVGDQDSMFVIDDHGVHRDNPLLKRYDRERDRLDRACKMAIDAGIAERYVQLAELQGQTLFRVMEAVHLKIGLTMEQKAAFLPALREAIAVEESNSANLAVTSG